MMDGAFQKALAYEGPGSYHELESHVEFGENNARQRERYGERGRSMSIVDQEKRREERRCGR